MQESGKTFLNTFLLREAIDRNVDAEILLFTYFPNKEIGTCGFKQFGKKTQQMCNTFKPLKDFNQYWMMVTSRLECLHNAKTVPANLFDIQYRGTGGVIDSVVNEQAVGANSIDKESATEILENYSKGNHSLNATTSAKHTPTNKSTNFVVCQTTAPTASTVVEETGNDNDPFHEAVLRDYNLVEGVHNPLGFDVRTWNSDYPFAQIIHHY
ncbi:hypothetical protein OUZ56_032038 [Daphnia magna]|uniref:Uncharacterized protein n=1 Tax=Daphnia magna TaxID=35525 RepID=A0ABQ9ZVZ8_9CRUS|nr:hypothetical protein OUZ56_032038 [Daphnia magna]